MSNHHTGPPPTGTQDLMSTTPHSVPSLPFASMGVFPMPPAYGYELPGMMPASAPGPMMNVSAGGQGMMAMPAASQPALVMPTATQPLPVVPPSQPRLHIPPQPVDYGMGDDLDDSGQKRKKAGQPRKGTDSKLTPHEKRSCVALRPMDDDGSRKRFSELEELYLIKGVQMDNANEQGSLKKHRIQWAKILRNKNFRFHPKRISVDLKDKHRNLKRKGLNTVADLLNYYKDQAPALISRAAEDGVDLTEDIAGYTVHGLSSADTAAAAAAAVPPLIPTTMPDPTFQTAYKPGFDKGTLAVPHVPPVSMSVAAAAPMAPAIPRTLNGNLMNVQVKADFTEKVIRRKMRDNLALTAIFNECKEHWGMTEHEVYFFVENSSTVLSEHVLAGTLKDNARKVLDLRASLYPPSSLLGK